MASRSDSRVALLPIRPRFARLIMNGQKKVELRKVRFRQEVSHIIVYASNPVQRILGYFDVSHIFEGPPDQLWAQYGAVCGMRINEFYDYYACSDRGVAIGIGDVHALPDPVPLTAVPERARPPQSFVYVGQETLDLISASAPRLAPPKSMRS